MRIGLNVTLSGGTDSRFSVVNGFLLYLSVISSNGVLFSNNSLATELIWQHTTLISSLVKLESAKKAVLQEALLDSKKKAEIIAETLGQKVVGIESAKCDEYEEEEFEEKVHYLCEMPAVSSLATMLSPDTILVDKSIDVTRIIE